MPRILTELRPRQAEAYPISDLHLTAQVAMFGLLLAISLTLLTQNHGSRCNDPDIDIAIQADLGTICH